MFYTLLVTTGVVHYMHYMLFQVLLGGIGTCGDCLASPCPGFNRGKTAPGGGRGSSQVGIDVPLWPINASVSHRRHVSKAGCCIVPVAANEVVKVCVSGNECEDE